MALYGPCTCLLIGLHMHKNIYTHRSLNIHAPALATHWVCPVNAVIFPSLATLIPVKKKKSVCVFVFCVISSCLVDLYKCPSLIPLLCLQPSPSLPLVPLCPVSYCVCFCVCVCVDKVKSELSVMCRALLPREGFPI